MRKAIRRAQALYLLVATLLVVAVLFTGRRISLEIADETAYELAHQYAVISSANFQVYMTPHMRMMEQIAFSTPVARWLANEHNDDIKTAAFDEIMRHAQIFPEAYMMFTVHESLAAYDFFAHLESRDDFVSWGYVHPGTEVSQWYVDTMNAEQPFILRIQRTRPDDEGNWQLYIWANHRIYYGNEFVGVFTIGTPFESVFSATFGGFEDGNKRGYIIDGNGKIRIDSTGTIETTADGLPFFPPVPEAEKNPALAAGIAAHLQSIRYGYFPLGTSAPGTVRLDVGNFHYSAISPVIGTDWSVVVLSPRDESLHPRYAILIAVSVIFLLLSVVGTSWLVRRFVLHPLQEIERHKKEDESANTILQSLPFSVELWDANYELIDCNETALIIHEVPTKEDYIGAEYKRWPEFQPCGCPSAEMFNEQLRNVENNARFEFMQLTWGGDLLPSEVFLVRIRQENGDVILAYESDLRQIKAAMLEADELNKIFIESSPHVINIWDESLTLLSTTHQSAKMFGCASQEDVIENFYKLSPQNQPDGSLSSEIAAQRLRQTFKEGYLRFEWMHCTLDGQPFPAEVTLVRFRRGGENFLAAYTVDLRPVKAAADERVSQMFDATPLLIDYWDKNFDIINCNKYAVDFFGFESKEHYLADARVTLPTVQANNRSSVLCLSENLEEVFRNGYGNFEFEEIKLTGEKVYLEVEAIRLKDASSGEDVVVTYSKDITKERENARKISEATAYKDALLASSPVFIDIWNEDFTLIDCNDRVCELLGVPSKEEFINNIEKYNPILQPCGTRSDVLYIEKFKIALKNGSVKFNWMHTDVKGQPVPVEVIYVQIVINGKRALVGHNYDLRDLIKAEEERKRVEVAEESNRAKTNFLARMSHEIRTPISAVLGISEIELQSPTLPPHFEESFAKINDSAQMLTNMVNDILDLSKIEAGKLKLFEEKYETEYLISNASALHLFHLGEKSIAFRMYVDPNLPTHLIGDEMRIGQILNNLLSNAFKYTEKGEVGISFQYGHDETLMISVTDTGFGMTREQLDALHHEYSRFHEQTNRLISGTGLGMSIVYNLVQLMQAEIDIDSEPDVGTSIVVIIPQKRASTDAIGAETAARLQKFERVDRNMKKFKFAPRLMPNRKVLVVDDLEANLYVTSGLLAFYELKVETCISGREAIEKVEAGNVYDLILMDYMMPGMTGTEAMREIRKTGYSKPIVVLTANAMIGMAEKFRDDGFDGFISKPINTTHLNTILLKHIAESPDEAADIAPVPAVNLDDFQKDETVLKKLRKLFSEQHKNAPAEIRESINVGDITAATIAAHSLKSSARLIYEEALAKAAETCELALNVAKTPSAAELDALEREFVRVYSSLPATANKRILEILGKLQPLLEDSDVPNETLINELKNTPEAAIFVAQVENYDFNDALVSLKTLQNMFREAF